MPIFRRQAFLETWLSPIITPFQALNEQNKDFFADNCSGSVVYTPKTRVSGDPHSCILSKLTLTNFEPFGCNRADLKLLCDLFSQTIGKFICCTQVYFS